MVSIVRHRQLFATPLTEVTVDGHDALNAQLLTEVAARRASEAGIVRSNRSGWHSEADFFQRKEEGHATLARQIAQQVRRVTEELASSDPASWKLSYDGWINVNGPGGHNAPHDHPGAFWSGVYYVAAPPKCGAIELIDPRTTPAAQELLGADAFASNYRIKPRAGLMIIFPSSLKHWVQPNEGEGERVSIAFNAGVRPAG